MKRLEQFRKYYNHTIYPELMRLERQRLRLLRLLFFSGLVLSGVLVFSVYIDVLALALFLIIPIGLYTFYVGYRIQQFRLTFKPQVMNLILDFIDDGMNFDPNHPLRYDPKGMVTKDRFVKSMLFGQSIYEYSGEDYIAGKVGEMVFEMSELTVNDLSRVRAGYQEVFRGVFMHATFPEETSGKVLIWPRHLKQFFTRAVRQFHWVGGANVDDEVTNEAFKSVFATYATEETHLAAILSEPMQAAILRYREQTGKDIFMAFLDREIYAAVSEEKDLMEPFLFRSNLDFNLIREFFEDILLLLRIAEDFDQTH